ncbi:MAG: hypothetical protein ACI90V_008057, partial [Bacillariaceae sp.]
LSLDVGGGGSPKVGELCDDQWGLGAQNMVGFVH